MCSKIYEDEKGETCSTHEVDGEFNNAFVGISQDKDRLLEANLNTRSVILKYHISSIVLFSADENSFGIDSMSRENHYHIVCNFHVFSLRQG